MKKWSGGTLIIALSIILVLRYSLMETIRPQKQPVASFFKNLSDSDTRLESNDINRLPHQEKILKHSKKPRLIRVDGADDLYSQSDMLEEESKVKLAWAKMQDLLSRSDSLPETAQGVKEASIAWKDLVATLTKEDALRAINNSNYIKGAGDQNCNFSLNALELSSVSDGSILEFPCGLVQDSSITVIGIPTKDRGSFQIELVGSQLAGEAKTPIILCYNVSLQGDALTQNPVVLQNTWTADHGWGVEERCPAHASADNLKVDGHIRCNEQVGGTIRDERVNGSQLSHEKFLNVSIGSGLRSYNFPFVEGHPFTATLWVGLEGFHMTVNGRHETSFAYRERLDPWLVSGVRVAGDLNVLSALANGLPVTEDPDLVVDLKYLKAPPVPKKRLLMLVGVFSTGNNFGRRMAIRRSWMQYKAVQSGDVAVRFFIGLHKNRQVNVKLWKEAEKYDDIQLMPFVDYYSLITMKTIAICIYGAKILPAKYIMKTDDDAFVRIDQVLTILKKRKLSDGLLYGLISFESAPHRDKDSKWYISEKEWPHASYPPWAHGPGYVISRDIAKFIVQGHQEKNLKLFKLEDVAMGIWIEQYKKSGKEVHYINDDRFYNAGCEAGYILAHYQGPRLMLCLWEKLQKECEAICCE